MCASSVFRPHKAAQGAQRTPFASLDSVSSCHDLSQEVGAASAGGVNVGLGIGLSVLLMLVGSHSVAASRAVPL